MAFMQGEGGKERGVVVGHAFGALIWGLKLLLPSVLDDLVKVWRRGCRSERRPISDWLHVVMNTLGGRKEKTFHSESEKPFQSYVLLYLMMILVIDRLICHCFVNPFRVQNNGGLILFGVLKVMSLSGNK